MEAIQTICKTKKKSSKREIGNLIFYICLIFLPLLQYAIFSVAVNFNSIIMAFQKWTYSKEIEDYTASFAGFTNFKRVFDELFVTGEFKVKIGNSLLAYGASLFITTPLALVFSYYISKKLKGAKIYRVILFIPTIICSVVLTKIFLTLCEAIIPTIVYKLFYKDQFATYALFEEDPIFSQYCFLSGDTAFGAMIFYSVFIGFGANVLLYTGAMSAIDKSTIEAAKLDGCSDWQEFLHVILPGVFPTLTTFIVVGIGQVFVNQLYLFDIFGAGASSSIQTLGYHLYTTAVCDINGASAGQRYETHPYLASLGLVLTVIITPITLGVKKMLEKFGPSAA